MLEDAIAFAGVSKYPARVKCALLGWMAWKDALVQAGRVRELQRRGQPMAELVATKDDVEEAMRDVVDPELGINVVDLGLVYGIDARGDRGRPGGDPRHDADLGRLPADRRHRGPGACRC